MSYALDMHFRPALRCDRLLDFFRGRSHYKIFADEVCYEHPKTGVYFSFKLRCARNIVFRRTAVSVEFEINNFRPSYFGIEAEKELSAFVSAFKPQIEDGQMHGMGEGAYSGEGFLSGWNFGNAFSVHVAISRDIGLQAETLPADDLRAVWEWNYHRAGKSDIVWLPTIRFLRIDGRLCRGVVWPVALPVQLPKVDYVLVGRDVAGEKRFGLAAWEEIVELARRAGFDTTREPLVLDYFTTPPEIAEWVANIPLVDPDTFSHVPSYRVLDEEVVAAARELKTEAVSIGDEELG
jgi:hypothetical protein